MKLLRSSHPLQLELCGHPQRISKTGGKELTGSYKKSLRRPLKLEEIFVTLDPADLGVKMEGSDPFPVDNISHVWLSVYDKLDPKDKLAFCGASSVWHDWLESRRTERLISEVVPQHTEAPSWSNFLRSREFCQSWKEEIDYQNQTHGSNLSFYFEIASEKGRLLMKNFFHYAKDHEDVTEYWRDYWKSIRLLLEQFGSHVHFAQICFDDGDDIWADNELGNLEGQAQLRECLLRLPNLKKVVIFGELGSPFLEDEIREFYRVNPLPRWSIWKRWSVSYEPRNEVLIAPILFHHLETLASLERRPPLREVYLSFEDAPHLEDVFRLLEHFGETLIQFRSSSRLRLRNDVENGEPFSCNLPHLKKIFFEEYWGTADLLFQFKSLTHVQIWQMRDTSLQFPGFKERLDDSSIWILMPCLQWLSLGNRATVYERVVMEKPRQYSIDNHDTTGLQGRTWSQECRLVFVEVVSSVLTDFFHGLLF
ncbi:hypothetical protein Ocin01_16537 [Orchesella cincta]|uniref:Uncharacterized protein n=1 Tax=Orchesella cincta TaxID=48709 RepID=A0A1D2MAY3_ORCCI|nr:hypothetical protein Ocin01_16537 [Orchesella cincta]